MNPVRLTANLKSLLLCSDHFSRLTLRRIFGSRESGTSAADFKHRASTERSTYELGLACAESGHSGKLVAGAFARASGTNQESGVGFRRRHASLRKYLRACRPLDWRGD